VIDFYYIDRFVVWFWKVTNKFEIWITFHSKSNCRKGLNLTNTTLYAHQWNVRTKLPTQRQILAYSLVKGCRHHNFLWKPVSTITELYGAGGKQFVLWCHCGCANSSSKRKTHQLTSFSLCLNMGSFEWWVIRIGLGNLQTWLVLEELFILSDQLLAPVVNFLTVKPTTLKSNVTNAGWRVLFCFVFPSCWKRTHSRLISFGGVKLLCHAFCIHVWKELSISHCPLYSRVFTSLIIVNHRLLLAKDCQFWVQNFSLFCWLLSY
jgi:hypothetical protein